MNRRPFRGIETRFIFPVVTIIVLLVFNACTVSKNTQQLLIAKDSYCDPGKLTAEFQRTISSNTDSVLVSNAELKTKYAEQSILIMHALGIGNDVKRLEGLRQDTSMEARMAALSLRQRIDGRILLADSEIDALAAELDCEGERIDQIAGYVDNINSARTTRLTVASIVVGAAAAVMGALINNDDWNKGVAIGAGTLGAGLGLATLNPQGKKVTLFHDRNLLRNVWQQQNAHEIGPFVWYMLTEKRFSNAGTTSLLSNTRQRWITYQFDGKLEAAGRSVNFSNGGIYKAGDLHARAEMINQLQSVVRSIKQNINFFLRELNP